MSDRAPPKKSRSLTLALVTLHRLPPLTRILAPGRRALSTSTTFVVWFNRRVKMAVASPAAPAPTMRMSAERGGAVMPHYPAI